MSRIGLKPITIPNGVEVKVDDKNFVEVKGPKGKIDQQLSPEMAIKIEDNIITISRPTESKKHKSLHGLTRTLMANMIDGVVEEFSKTLEIQGTGYRAQKQGKKLVLNLGFSHPIEMEDPEGIVVEVPQPNKIVIKGIDKQKVGNYAAVIRSYREPEPYKGKGVRYEGEMVRRKVGKTGK
ncbi:50S ribosomal protein L6 [Anaerosalibacter bizertensis]|uniref:Large ribosomal subunit protein uL6 n=1 Tax=Anaerosalibacter bizertensis TaxID=932217 RepID=A0A9Q4ABF9_9FIRM|nr:50S ribosomal protein L6 [Anaerosalibacter bizertensis]MBV1816810.1 50S ribosomal protein L6 [Bacteroidales bacterium MSK.15.36]MCB5559663.1 50S ribosomal protein L6 [Anaerosalibacter bizertensis]MCG4564440.1 50S ribosomal protein L6 [Anaerosalibacter bizertensis]MCG4582475.1 50S ribosomal protein L6 [Anaerosalibacter bizertensis]